MLEVIRERLEMACFRDVVGRIAIAVLRCGVQPHALDIGFEKVERLRAGVSASQRMQDGRPICFGFRHPPLFEGEPKQLLVKSPKAVEDAPQPAGVQRCQALSEQPLHHGYAAGFKSGVKIIRIRFPCQPLAEQVVHAFLRALLHGALQQSVATPPRGRRE